MTKNLLKLAFFVRKFKKIAMKFEPAQIVRKSSQVVGQTRHNSTQVQACNDLRSRLIRP